MFSIIYFLSCIFTLFSARFFPSTLNRLKQLLLKTHYNYTKIMFSLDHIKLCCSHLWVTNGYLPFSFHLSFPRDYTSQTPTFLKYSFCFLWQLTSWFSSYFSGFSFSVSFTSLFSLCVYSFSYVWLFVTPWTVAHRAPLSMGILQATILEWVAILLSRDHE